MLTDSELRLLRAFPEAAVLVTPAGSVLAANDAGHRALHLSAERAHNLLSLVADPTALEDTLRRWAGTTAPSPGAFVLMANETSVTCNAKGSLIGSASEARPAIVLIRFWPRTADNPFLLLNQQVTRLNDEVERRKNVEEALRKSQTALRERAVEAEALNRAKDEFLATVSHELRTPLSAIMGWSSLLRVSELEGQVAKAIDAIHRNAQAQARIIDDILDVSRIITGRLLVEEKPCDLGTVVDEALEVVRTAATAKGIELSFERPSEPCLWVVDPVRMRQVVWNLLSNSVKFSEPGGTVHVALRPRGPRLELIVSDTGRGIDPSFLPFVFDRFRQADSSTTRRSGGLGLGLSVVRHIVELHGGSVAASSEGLGKGATFVVTLAAHTPSPQPDLEEPRTVPSAPEGPPSPKALEGLKILLVDDEPDARELAHTILTRAGAVVELAGSAQEAFALLGHQPFDVLVSDIGLPEEDGYGLLQRLRALSPAEVSRLPAIALTAYTRPEDRDKALRAGFTLHMGKPVNATALVAAVARVFEGSRG